MKLIQPTLKLIRENRKAYITLNITFYSLLFMTMIVAVFTPDIQAELMEKFSSTKSGPIFYLFNTLRNADVLKAILVIFSINFFSASLLFMTIPSLIIPFVGILTFVYRAIIWGFSCSPASPHISFFMILIHSVTLILEGQAYILVMFAIYLHGSAFLWPRKAGVDEFDSGYLVGLKRSIKIYPMVIILLAIAAIYEALSLVYLI